jgi:hypothetical protein
MGRGIKRRQPIEKDLGRLNDWLAATAKANEDSARWVEVYRARMEVQRTAPPKVVLVGEGSL